MTTTDSESPFQGNQPKNTGELAAWHSRTRHENVIDPELVIIDPHHHLFDAPARGQRYLLPDLLSDISGGHNITATVYVEAYHSMWRRIGPPEMRAVGEVEFAAGVAAMAESGTYGDCRVAAAMVSHADLRLGERVDEVLQAQQERSGGRLRGIRQQVAYEPGHIGSFIMDRAPEHLMLDTQFQRGFARLARLGLSFDVWAYHTQLAEVQQLASRFPDTTIILNHVGGVMGVADYCHRRDEIFAYWRNVMKTLVPHKNVKIKVGGMGMAVFGFGFEQRDTPPSSAALAQAWKPYIETCIEIFGPQRCMFESNFPVDKQSCGYTELWNAFKLVTRSLSASERASLFSQTALNTYRIESLE